MQLKNARELEVTHQKLQMLEEHYREHQGKPDGNPHAHELSMRSIKRLINQLKEQIARFQSRTAAASKNGEGR